MSLSVFFSQLRPKNVDNVANLTEHLDLKMREYYGYGDTPNLKKIHRESKRGLYQRMWRVKVRSEFPLREEGGGQVMQAASAAFSWAADLSLASDASFLFQSSCGSCFVLQAVGAVYFPKTQINIMTNISFYSFTNSTSLKLYF